MQRRVKQVSSCPGGHAGTLVRDNRADSLGGYYSCPLSACCVPGGQGEVFAFQERRKEVNR